MNVELTNILLKDRTTGKNIIWATNDYKEFGYEEENEIKSEQVNVIRPRYEKIREHQKNRTRDKAEIFTPSWLCNEQKINFNKFYGDYKLKNEVNYVYS